jgi:hypothetical protein
MPLIASFNFHISLGAVATAVGLVLAFLVLLGTLRSMLLGSLCGGLICGGLYLVASGIARPRRVAVPESEPIAGTVFFAILGLVLGAIAGTLGEAFRGRPPRGGAKKPSGGMIDD